jgi:hypothetical protein
VTIAVTAASQYFADVSDLLPPRARPTKHSPEHGHFALVEDPDNGLLNIECDGEPVTGALDRRLALGILDAELRMYIALNAPDHVFVHAGVVGVGDQAIVLPGRSFAGKTTLVAALVEAGAEYWSDEYAALDADGLVHPYPKPLSVRINDTRATEERPVESLGGRAGDRPLPVAVIAFTSYRPGATWTQRSCTVGEGAVKLLEHSIAARSRPEQVLAAVRRAATDAVVLEGDRGDADEAANALLSPQPAQSDTRSRARMSRSPVDWALPRAGATSEYAAIGVAAPVHACRLRPRRLLAGLATVYGSHGAPGRSPRPHARGRRRPDRACRASPEATTSACSRVVERRHLPRSQASAGSPR